MVFGRIEDFEKYKKRLSRKAIAQSLSLKTLIFLFLLTVISIVCAWLYVYDYSSFTKEAYIYEFVSYALCCFTYSWFARGIVRLKKAKGFEKFFIIGFLALCAVLTVALLNELYLYANHMKCFTVYNYFNSVIEDIKKTSGMLWARYPCIFIATALSGTLISMGWTEKITKCIGKIFEPAKMWFIRVFSVTDEYDIETEEKHNIFVTGDLHGEQARITWFNKLRKNNVIKSGDYLAVCGDFGFLFDNDDKENKVLDDIEANYDFTLIFADGNHENFEAINSHPVELWNGGKVHRIRKNIIHLMRGQVYEIDGLKLFTMGGAYSIDRYLRKKGVSYWEEEIPVNEEYREAAENLNRNNMKVDVILTHTAPEELVRRLGYVPDVHDAELTGFLEWIFREVDFQKWYFGHWHVDQEMIKGCRAVHFDLIRLNCENEIIIKEEVIDYDIL